MMEVDSTQWFYGIWAIIGAGLLLYGALMALALVYEWIDDMLGNVLWWWDHRKDIE